MRRWTIFFLLILGSYNSIFALNIEEEADKLYQQAYKLVLEKNYEQAQKQLTEIINNYQRSSWVDDASFWLCYTVEKSQNDKGLAFDYYARFVEKYKNSKWRDDAMQNMALLARVLEKEGRGEYALRLKEFKNEANDELTMAALQALQHRGDKRAYEKIVQIYDKTKSKRIKDKLVYMISSFNNKAAAEKLRHIAVNEEDAQLREKALFWLANEFSSKQTAQFLRERVEQDASRTVREKAVFGISQLSEALAVKELTEIAQSHKDEHIRAKAIFWLGDIGGDQKNIDLLLGFVKNDPSQLVRDKAIFALSQIETPQALDALLNLAKTAKQPHVRSKAIFWLGQSSKDEKYIEAFYNIALKDKDYGVREKAIFSLAEVNTKQSTHYLSKIIESNAADSIREKALFWLSQSTPTESALKLFKKVLYAKGSFGLKEKAVFGLSELDDGAGIPLLIEVAKSHPNTGIRKKAIFWLGHTDDDRALDAIDAILEIK